MIDPIKKAIFGYSELGEKEDSLGVKAIDHYALLLEAAASRKELLRDAPTTQQYMRASDIDKWFDDYDKWRARVAKELGDD